MLLYKQLLGIRAKLSNPTSSHSQLTSSRRVRFITWGILLKCRLQSSREMSRDSEGNVISSECESYNPLEEGDYNILKWVKWDWGWRMKEIRVEDFLAFEVLWTLQTVLWVHKASWVCKPFFFCNLNPFLSRAIQVSNKNNVKAESVLQRLEHLTRDSWATEKKHTDFIHRMVNKWMIMVTVMCFYSHLYFQ